MHIEILQSPSLCELMAFYINMREGNTNKKAVVELFDGCSIKFDDGGKPTLCCGLFDSMKIEIDLTCSICLVSVFFFRFPWQTKLTNAIKIPSGWHIFRSHSLLVVWTHICCHVIVNLVILQEIVFDPVALSCGHLFCYMCCCSAASVTIVDGLKFASSTAKCPLCRLVHWSYLFPEFHGYTISTFLPGYKQQ